MGVLSIILLVIFVLTALLMVAVVLMQDEGGEGLGGIFGGGGGSQQMGSRSGNILTRTTAVLGAIFLLTAFGLAWLNRTPEAGSVEDVAREAQSGQETVEWWRTDSDESDSGTGDGSALPEEGGGMGSASDESGQ
jgi:preprotein translocase subunit SecG